MSIRPVLSTTPAQATLEGAGVKLHRDLVHEVDKCIVLKIGKVEQDCGQVTVGGVGLHSAE